MCLFRSAESWLDDSNKASVFLALDIIRRSGEYFDHTDEKPFPDADLARKISATPNLICLAGGLRDVWSMRGKKPGRAGKQDRGCLLAAACVNLYRSSDDGDMGAFLTMLGITALAADRANWSILWKMAFSSRIVYIWRCYGFVVKTTVYRNTCELRIRRVR